jgi:hypothetical protein
VAVSSCTVILTSYPKLLSRSVYVRARKLAPDFRYLRFLDSWIGIRVGKESAASNREAIKSTSQPRGLPLSPACRRDCNDAVKRLLYEDISPQLNRVFAFPAAVSHPFAVRVLARADRGRNYSIKR